MRIELRAFGLACLLAGLLSAGLHAQSQSNDRLKDPVWLGLEALNIQARYQFIETGLGNTLRNHLQHKQQAQGELWLEPGRRLSMKALVSGGGGFTSSWNGTGWGSDAVTNLWVRELFLALKPATGINLEYGGLGIVRGQSTEITTYDNDGYLVGGRLTVRRPGNLFFDRIAVTYAYLGDLRTPDVFKRLDRWDESNYHQFQVEKRLSDRLTLSADYTFQAGVETLRQAARVAVPEAIVVDSVRFENYQRVDVERDFGFAVQGWKAFHPRVEVGAGYADIDPAYGGLNADRFNIGRRFFALANLFPMRDLTIEMFIQRAVANDFTVSNRTRVDVILNYNLLSGLRHAF